MTRPWHARRGAAAFTLIEVLMAAAILAIGAAGTLMAYSSIMGLIEHQRRLADAVNVTQQVMEHLMLIDGANGLLNPGSHGPIVLDGIGRDSGPSATEAYAISWVVTDDEPSTGYLEVAVQSQWQELRGARFVRFAAYRER